MSSSTHSKWECLSRYLVCIWISDNQAKFRQASGIQWLEMLIALHRKGYTIYIIDILVKCLEYFVDAI